MSSSNSTIFDPYIKAVVGKGGQMSLLGDFVWLNYPDHKWPSPTPYEHPGILAKIFVQEGGTVARVVDLIPDLRFSTGCSFEAWGKRAPVLDVGANVVTMINGDWFDGTFHPLYSDGERCIVGDRVYLDDHDEVACGVVTHIRESGICLIRHIDRKPVFWAVPPFGLRKMPESFGLTLFDENFVL